MSILNRISSLALQCGGNMSSAISRERILSVGFQIVDPALLSNDSREKYLRRKEAIELKLDNCTGSEIERITGVDKSEQTRLFKRYTTLNESGVFFGESALVPGFRIKPYQRVKPPQFKHTEAQGGLSGVLGYTLEKHPEVAEKFEKEVFRRDFQHGHGAKFSKKGLCRYFYDLCKAAGVNTDEWPLNKLRGARKTIGVYIDTILQNDFKRAALATGGKIALTHSKAGTGWIPLLEDFDVYDFIEIDSWHADAFFVIYINGDKRVKTEDVISRIWMIAAVCRRSNAILAIKFIFSSEIRAQDLVDLICEAYAGEWAPRKVLNVRDMKYTESAGMPCYALPQLRYHTWGSVCLDNAMQHHANNVYELALHTLGFATNYGPLEQPARRPKVEGLFKRIAANVFHQTVSTTGSNPQNGRAESPEKAAIHYQVDVDDALEVMDVLTANYNGTPQGGANKGNSPLAILRGYCLEGDYILPRTHEAYINSIALGSIVRPVKVTGSIAKGIRPRIKLDQAIYTSPDLAESPHLIGQLLSVRINPHDYRKVKAYLPGGVYFGVLTVEAAWRNVPHSVTTRRLINRALAKKEFQIMDGENPIVAWQKHIRANASARNNRETRRLQEELQKATWSDWPESQEPTTDSAMVSTSELWRNLAILR